MRKVDWLIACTIMTMGLMCMTFSATSIGGSPFLNFGRTLMQLCFYVGMPILLLTAIYIYLRKK